MVLKNLRLRRVREVLDRELKKSAKAGASYEELLATLLRLEYQDRQERSLEARIKRAKLPERWTLETFPFKKQPGVKKRAIRQLTQLDFVTDATNIVFIGPTDPETYCYTCLRS